MKTVSFCFITFLFITCIWATTDKNCKSIGTACTKRIDCKLNPNINTRDCLCVFRNESVFGEDVGVCMPKEKYLKNCKHKPACDNDVCFCSQGDCDFCFNDMDCTTGNVCEDRVVTINGKQQCTPSDVPCIPGVTNATCVKVCVPQAIVPPNCDVCSRNFTTLESSCTDTSFTCSIGGQCFYTNETDCINTVDQCNPVNLGAECPPIIGYTSSCGHACITKSSCNIDCLNKEQACFSQCGNTAMCLVVCEVLLAVCSSFCNV